MDHLSKDIHRQQDTFRFFSKVFKTSILSRKDKENLPKEFLFDGEQEMLKQVHLLKNELREKGWSESDPPKITQPSFLRTDIGIDESSHRFNCKLLFII